MADGPLAPAIAELLQGRVALIPWVQPGERTQADAIYTYGHPLVNGEMLDRLGRVKVISNYGVGVDHIHLPDARSRGIPVANTPGILDGATADMAFTLLLAAARRLVEGERYARSPAFTHYDPGYMLGREVHSSTIGIIGLGRIGTEIARRALGFSMQVLYHNRHRREDVESRLGVQYSSLENLLAIADFVVLSVPLTPQTHRMISRSQLALMKSTAILINVARGPIVDTDALTEALAARRIYAAALDVTDPEPLPRDHPLLRLENVIIAPHLGSATAQTRQRMAEISIENLLAGLEGRPLLHEVMA